MREQDLNAEIYACDDRIRFYHQRQVNRQDMADHLNELAEQDAVEVEHWTARRDYWLGQLGIQNIAILQTNPEQGGAA